MVWSTTLLVHVNACAKNHTLEIQVIICLILSKNLSKYKVSLFLNLWILIYLGFQKCLNKWCIQSGSLLQQSTMCKRVSEDGRTCYNPQIRYGYLNVYGYNHNSYRKTGGYPINNGNNKLPLYYKQWCQQLFPKKTIISSSVTYDAYNKPSNYMGALYWCYGYDENSWHWCDLTDGYWYNNNQPLGPYNWYRGLQVVASLTCQY